MRESVVPPPARCRKTNTLTQFRFFRCLRLTHQALQCNGERNLKEPFAHASQSIEKRRKEQIHNRLYNPGCTHVLGGNTVWGLKPDGARLQNSQAAVSPSVPYRRTVHIP